MKFYQKKWFWILAIIIAIIIIVIIQRSKNKEDVYITQKAEKSSVISKTVTATGIAKAPKSFNLAFPFSGIVEEINVQVGDTVQKGDVLAKLDSESLYLESQMKKATFEGGLKSAQIAWEAAKEDLENTIQVNKEKKDQTRTKYHDAADYKDAVEDYTEQVKDDSGSSSSAYKQALYSEISAENARKEALDSHELTKKQVEESEDNTRQSLRDAEEDLKQKSKNYSSATLSYNWANYLSSLDILEKAALKAPTTGIITGVNNEIGEIASPTLPTISIISKGLQIEVDVPEADITKIAPHMEAKITFDAFSDDQVFRGEIIKIDPAETLISDVVYYKTTIILQDDETSVKPGMTANITIEIQKKENILTIPQIAVFEKDGKDMVRILKNGKAEEIEVKTGIFGDDGNVEIISGLEEDQEVIVSESK